ncbi:PepSY domain-containing protein [Corynebacterium pacaense]|uniref:PepSY domain-containing protein n=1 Tax=Corynebacterium pacaense TaxID=1816684 RepID=UPI0009BBB9AC|nr:PepSY domain-containing protein [Corynebacterium pacaense]
MPRRPLPAALAGTALLLSGCAATDSPDDAPATTPATTAQAAPTGIDPAFAVIDAVLAQHPGGVITVVDHDLRTGSYDVDVVIDAAVIKLEVDDAGRISVAEREGDDDEDVRAAADATVTVAEALRQALDLHPDALADDLELEEDDGRLIWEIDLDTRERTDLVELSIPAVAPRP